MKKRSLRIFGAFLLAVNLMSAGSVAINNHKIKKEEKSVMVKYEQLATDSAKMENTEMLQKISEAFNRNK